MWHQCETLLLQSVNAFLCYSSGLWSPIDTASSPSLHSANSFSAFGPNNSFNLTGGTAKPASHVYNITINIIAIRLETSSKFSKQTEEWTDLTVNAWRTCLCVLQFSVEWMPQSHWSLSKAGRSSPTCPPPPGTYQAMTPCTPGPAAQAHRLPQLQ